MQRLILLRHAKAERQAESGEDFDRPLSGRGLADARLMGQVLFDAGLRPTLALVSAARRTRETWEQVQAAFPEPAAIRIEQSLYSASSPMLRRKVEELEGREGVLVIVGHNPGLHQFALDLLIEGAAPASAVSRAAARFPPASAAVFAFDAAGRPCDDGLYFAADYGGRGAE